MGPSSGFPHRPAGRCGGARRLARLGRLGALGLLAALPLVVAAWLATGWRPLLRVETPLDGATVDVAGLELLVRFPEPARVEAATFEVRLNGADVTGRVQVADNGVHGRLQGFLDGENRLEIAVFGRPWWAPGVWVEQRRRLRLTYRSPTDWNRG